MNYVLKILPLPLTQAKNDDQQYWKEKFHTANGKAQHAHGPYLFLLGVRWGGELFFVFLPGSQCVPNMFSSCSLKVLQVFKLFPKVFPVVPHLSIWFAQSSTLICINWKGRLLGILLFLFYNGIQRNASFGESFNVPKELLMGQWIWLFQKIKIKLWTHPWTN
jgi:hypothetical protein